MRIQHNIPAINSYRNLMGNNSAVAKNLEKLSSGYRINRAGDDAAGLAISEKMRSQIKGLETAVKNSNDAISLVQTAEGALTEVHSMMNRMVELATQSANGIYDNNVDRKAIQDEFDSLTTEIDRIADATNFNKKNLLDGSLDGSGVKTTATDGSSSAAGKLELDFTGKTGENYIGESISVGNSSFKVVEGDTPGYTNGVITLAKDSDADTIAAQVVLAANGATSKNAVIDGIEIGATADATHAKADASGPKVTITQGANGENKGFAKFDNSATYKKNAASMTLQIGDTNDNFNHIKVAVKDMHAKALGIDGESISVSTQTEAGEAIKSINDAINSVSSQRGKLGATQNRLEHTINNLNVNVENMTAAESRIRDVDMAKEMMSYTKNNILVQASQAMLAQANQVPQGVLQLLQ